MPDICFYFQVHQPLRLRHYTVFDKSHQYFDESRNASICKEVANKCYLPANRLILKLIRRFAGEFKVAYSLTGILLEQLQRHSPEVLSTFDALAETGCVEFLAETYYHSLSFLYSPQEFIEQVNKHIETIDYLFGQRPRIFRNTELIYNNELAALVESTGNFDAILTEGADYILGARSADFTYRPQGCSRLKLLLKNHSLSDDIAFRFCNRTWSEWPLTPEKFARWISNINGNGNVVNLFLDYETLGEHEWPAPASPDASRGGGQHTGIFHFMQQLPHEVLKYSDNSFRTPSEVVRRFDPIGTVDAPHLISWADTERDLSTWLGNPMQSNAIYELYRLEERIKQTADEEIISDWRRLQAADHFYNMCTKSLHAPASPDARRGSGSDGDVHSSGRSAQPEPDRYFNPYESPYDSYINFMNVLGHLHDRCAKHTQGEQFYEPSQNKNPPLTQGFHQTV
jgi:alpha-amylase